MKLQTAVRVKNWLGLCLSNLKTDATADIKLVGKFEELCANLDGIISKLQKTAEAETTEKKDNG